MNAPRSGSLDSCFRRSLLLLFAAFLARPLLAGGLPLFAAPQAGQQESAPQQPEARSPREIAELKADILMARKMYSDAIAAYEELLKNEPKNAELLNRIGVCYSQLTKLDKAKKYYERAIKVDPQYASALNNLGTVHFYQKRFRRAVKVYQRAIVLQPDSATFHGNLGHAHFADKKYPEAISSFRRALELDPQVFERRSSAGSILQTRSVEQRALFYFYMAKTYAGLGNAERCAHFLKRAIEEGYKDIVAVEKDPAFAAVINDPQVKEALQTPPPAPAGKPTG
ncbi:MAG: tetratricopeptide repeat protein [Acidobacteria bacterium]|nr:tetratricopeptide repeat protein [Acidobacteriota bacterium]MBI3662434.1 tetratricopeptide repeat protein [Acidobacteriota bacterium]